MECRDFNVAVVWLGLLAGLTGLLVHTVLIFDAASHSGEVFPKYVTEVDYNYYGEGDFELFFILGMTFISAYACYIYFKQILMG